MKFPKTKGEILLWIAVLIGLFIIAPFVKKIVGKVTQRIIRKYFPEKYQKKKFPLPYESANQVVVLSYKTFHALFDYRSVLRNFALCLANFRILNYDFSSMPALIYKKEELNACEQSFKHLSNPESSFNSQAVLEKYKIQAESAIVMFNNFTQSNIEKLQILYNGYNPAVHNSNYYWLQNIAPVYRDYLREKLLHINETYNALKKIDEYIDGVAIGG
ncbi:MAG TPA: hypothetical protein PLL71_10765 [Agriterribacter sp.]|nr:hypothetical protein [Agriterribacter sp.]HRQ50431.1 hypothetical protein [Agriterribacter sp.]